MDSHFLPFTVLLLIVSFVREQCIVRSTERKWKINIQEVSHSTEERGSLLTCNSQAYGCEKNEGSFIVVKKCRRKVVRGQQKCLHTWRFFYFFDNSSKLLLLAQGGMMLMILASNSLWLTRKVAARSLKLECHEFAMCGWDMKPKIDDLQVNSEEKEESEQLR